MINMRGIVKRFYIGQPNELEILHGIDLDVTEGEFLSIVGASGSGKSTLMNLIGALDRPTSGTYFLDGQDVGQADDLTLSAIRCKKVGFVFQNFNLIPRTNALKNVELPMMYAGVAPAPAHGTGHGPAGYGGNGGSDVSPANELSGGQKQRVAMLGPWPMIRPSCWRMSLPALGFQDRPAGHGYFPPAQPGPGQNRDPHYP